MPEFPCPSCGAPRNTCYSDCPTCSWRSLPSEATEAKIPDPTEAKIQALSRKVDRLEGRCRRVSRLLGLSVIGLLALFAVVVVFGRSLGIPSSAGSFTTEKADITTIRVKELMILNGDGTVAGSLNARYTSGTICLYEHSEDGQARPVVLFFQGPSAILVNRGAWQALKLGP